MYYRFDDKNNTYIPWDFFDHHHLIKIETSIANTIRLTFVSNKTQLSHTLKLEYNQRSNRTILEEEIDSFMGEYHNNVVAKKHAIDSI
jgi:hypothetical protein